jgi:copper transport protein
MRSIPLLLTALALLLAVPAGRAHAHAEFLGSEPADGALLEAWPPAVALRFSEPVVPLQLRLLDPAGGAVSLPAPSSAASRDLQAFLPPTLGHGSHVLSWRVRSADGHPIAGALVLSIGHVSQAPAAAAEGPAWPVALEPFAQALFYAGTLAVVGLVLFGRLIHPQASGTGRHGLRLAAAVAVGGGVVAVACRGCALAATGPLAPAALLAGWTSPLGARVGLAGAGLVLLVAGGDRWPWPALGLAAALAAFPLAGHMAAAEPGWAATPALVLHVGLAAFWLGAFWPLLRLLRGDPAAAVPVVERFSRAATIAVPLLLATGIFLATRQLASPSALWAGRYGLLLSLKLALVVGLLALAARNRRRLTPALAAGMPGAARRLRRSIVAEIACAGLVLLVTAHLSTTSPHPATGHAGHAVMQAARTLALREGERRAVLRLEPGRVGRNRLELALTDLQGRPATALEATLELAAPAAGIEPLTRPLQPAGPGRFTLPDLLIPSSGPWRLTLSVLVSDFERADFTGEITLP